MTARFDRWLLRPAPARRLAVTRILMGGFVLIYLLATSAEFDRVSRLPPNQFDPVGVAVLLDDPVSRFAVWTFFVVLVLVGLAFTTGTAFRLSGPLFGLGVLGWASYHSSWGQMLHFEHLFTLHLLIIGFAPAAAACSVDARRRRLAAGDAEEVRFGWPLQLAALVTVLSYVIAGISKLRIGGLAWLDATTLQHHIAYSATRMDLLGARRPPLASFVIGQPWLLGPMAWVALLIELSAPVALLGRRWRRLWVPAVVLLHIGTAATMLVWFPYQGLGFAFIPLFAAERLLDPVRRVFQDGRYRVTRSANLTT